MATTLIGFQFLLRSYYPIDNKYIEFYVLLKRLIDYFRFKHRTYTGIIRFQFRIQYA